MKLIYIYIYPRARPFAEEEKLRRSKLRSSAREQEIGGNEAWSDAYTTHDPWILLHTKSCMYKKY